MKTCLASEVPILRAYQGRYSDGRGANSNSNRSPTIALFPTCRPFARCEHLRVFQTLLQYCGGMPFYTNRLSKPFQRVMETYYTSCCTAETLEHLLSPTCNRFPARLTQKENPFAFYTSRVSTEKLA